jgi:TRAP-type C4-dicarboxylate transport system substrate-binding protein
MEAPLDSVLSQKFHLAAPNVSLTEHVYASMTLAMNGRRFASLSPELQDVLRQAAASAADRADELADEFAQEVVAGLEADSATVIEVDRQAFADLLTAAAYEQEQAGLWSEGLYDRIQSLD